jgi:hypothetical protein
LSVWSKKETGNQPPLSIVIIGMLAAFMGGRVSGILQPNCWKR